MNETQYKPGFYIKDKNNNISYSATLEEISHKRSTMLERENNPAKSVLERKKPKHVRKHKTR